MKVLKVLLSILAALFMSFILWAAGADIDETDENER